MWLTDICQNSTTEIGILLYVISVIIIRDTKLEANVYCFYNQCKMTLYPYPVT